MALFRDHCAVKQAKIEGVSAETCSASVIFSPSMVRCEVEEENKKCYKVFE